MRPTFLASWIWAMPETTVQKMIGAITILISLMKPSPSALIHSLVATDGQSQPTMAPNTIAISTWIYRTLYHGLAAGGAIGAPTIVVVVIVSLPLKTPGQPRSTWPALSIGTARYCALYPRSTTRRIAGINVAPSAFLTNDAATNGIRPTCQAFAAPRPRPKASQPKPAARMRMWPTAMAANSSITLRSQPRSASQPVTNAAPMKPNR